MKDFSERLINWYSKNKRDLPWRNTNDAYLIWLSEIILQQTRVDQGLPYYEKFASSFPTVQDLANAKEDKVMSLWQGLGYYSRARNLHAGAKYISEELKGVFPNNYNDIIKIKGVGPYTAAAIASFAFNEVKPVVDGNVIRVISRFFGIKEAVDKPATLKQILDLCNALIDKQNPAVFNQAIMEFGAMACTPKKPNCLHCIFNDKCMALKNDLVDSIPFKQGKTKKTDKYFDYLFFYSTDLILINKRSGKGIWESLYEGFLVENNKDVAVHNFIKDDWFYDNIPGNCLITPDKERTKHVLSHQNLYIRFWDMFLNDSTALKAFAKENKLEAVKIDSIDQLGFPIVIRNWINKWKDNRKK